MIKFLIKPRFTIIELIGNVYIYALWVEYQTWKVFLLGFAFGLFQAILESIERINNGNYK